MNDIKNIIYSIRIKNRNRILHAQLLKKLSKIFQICDVFMYYQKYYVDTYSKIKYRASFFIRLHHIEEPPTIGLKQIEYLE